MPHFNERGEIFNDDDDDNRQSPNTPAFRYPVRQPEPAANHDQRPVPPRQHQPVNNPTRTRQPATNTSIIIAILVVATVLGGLCIVGVGGAALLNSGQSSSSEDYPLQDYSPPASDAPSILLEPASEDIPEVPTFTEDTRRLAHISSEVSEVNLRRTPGYTSKNESDVIVRVPTGATVEILKGPESEDGLDWWYVSWNGYKGWMADHTSKGRTILIFD